MNRYYLETLTAIFILLFFSILFFTIYRIFRWIFKERYIEKRIEIEKPIELDIDIYENHVVIRDKQGKLIEVLAL